MSFDYGDTPGLDHCNLLQNRKGRIDACPSPPGGLQIEALALRPNRTFGALMHSGPMRFVFENREEDKSDLKIRGGRRHCHVYHRPFGRAIALAARLLKQRQTYILVGGSFLPQCIINGTLSTTPAICTIGEQLPLSMHLICREIDTRAWTIDETRSRRAFRACSANPTIYTGFRNQGLFSHSPCSPSISALPPLKHTRRTCKLTRCPTISVVHAAGTSISADEL
jgi:hypothetical protein